MNGAGQIPVGNPTRDYWRTVMVNEVAQNLGHSLLAFETVLIRNKDMLGGSMRTLLDELCDQQISDGRTNGMRLGCRRRCLEIAQAYRTLASANAPRLPSAPIEELF